MISEKEIFPIGKTLKSHGVKGEILISFSSDIFENEDFKFLILEIDGIFVPFFIDECHIRSSETAFVKLEGINSEKAARELMGKQVFAPKKYLEKVKTNEIGFDYFIDFQIIDKNNGALGTIMEIDRSTANLLMIIETDDTPLLVPFAESYITDIDHNNKQIFVDLPEGLLDL
ncbi:ribosome maturation factor RimM [Bacteroidia bacterium]|nr:ribosome maturation factor RimM [Bacteroidia bacterium]